MSRLAVKAHGKFLCREKHWDGLFGIMFGPLERWAWTTNPNEAVTWLDSCFEKEPDRLAWKFEPCAEVVYLDVVEPKPMRLGL